MWPSDPVHDMLGHMKTPIFPPRAVVAVVFCWMNAFCGLASALDAAPRPNVIVIVLDDLGGADLGCYGSRFHRTPHIDRLAGLGVRFTQAYAASPVCSPSRAALMTGKYPVRFQITDWLPGRADRSDQSLLRPPLAQQLPLEEVTLAEHLRAAGYATASIGKWHLGGAGFGPREQGFDVNVGGDEAGTPLSYFAPYAGRGRTMPGLEAAPEGEYLTDRLTSEAANFVAANAQRPFFLYLAHFAPHIPLKAPAERIAHYPPATPFRGQQNNPIYAAMIESIDTGLGRLLDALDKHGIADRTWIFLTSDNGGLCTLEGPHTPPTSNAPLREGKGYLYEGGLRVPFIVRGPGVVEPGRADPTPVCGIDLLPTVLALCAVPSAAPVDGLSLVPVLAHNGALRREALYWHYPHYSNQGGRPGGAMRQGAWKWIEFYDDPWGGLYNLESDSRENRSAFADDRPRAEAMRGQFNTWLQSVGGQRMAANPQYVPNPQAENGEIVLPAKTARTYGRSLRYEPMPHKDTLGFWTQVDDYAVWQFEVSRPGAFVVEALIGCGRGSGGSEVRFEFAPVAAMPATAAPTVHALVVAETGGFQEFVKRELGRQSLPQAGRYRLTVRAQSKPGPAVMDLRQVTLRPAE